MKVDIINWGGDSEVLTLYLDGEKMVHGDRYHDGITYFIEGYIAALQRTMDEKLEINRYSIPIGKCKKIATCGNEPPKKWPEKNYMKWANKT